METEVEAKFLDIDVAGLRLKLKEIGATLEHSERPMRRKTYDDKASSLRKVGGWIRLRDEGDKITLSYKQLNDRTLHGTKEITVIVSDFETTDKLLGIVGFEEKSFQETKREKWVLAESEITIDTWPWIPTFVEIESPNEEVIKKVSRLLGLNWGEALHGSVETAYQKYYNVTEDEIDDWREITFIPVPDWLEAKRKKP
ncbi:MAG: CYTH domain-containing protein [Candidatus Paceibacterota bacterium]|jgi:adenylate cyclase class 2